MATVNQLIGRVLRKIGVYQSGEDISAEDFSDTLEELNSMLATWANDKLLGPSVVRLSKVLTISDGEYTIGAGADIVATRPVRIDRAFVRDSAGNDYSLQQIGRGEYADITTKSEVGRPSCYYYENAVPLGKIYLFTVPDAAYTLYLDAWYQFAQYSNPASEVSLPAGYDDAIVYNLCTRIASDFGKTLPPEVVVLAGKTLSKLKEVNSLDIPIVRVFPRTQFDIQSGY